MRKLEKAAYGPGTRAGWRWGSGFQVRVAVGWIALASALGCDTGVFAGSLYDRGPSEEFGRCLSDDAVIGSTEVPEHAVDLGVSDCRQIADMMEPAPGFMTTTYRFPGHRLLGGHVFAESGGSVQVMFCARDETQTGPDTPRHLLVFVDGEMLSSVPGSAEPVPFPLRWTSDHVIQADLTVPLPDDGGPTTIHLVQVHDPDPAWRGEYKVWSYAFPILVQHRGPATVRAFPDDMERVTTPQAGYFGELDSGSPAIGYTSTWRGVVPLHYVAAAHVYRDCGSEVMQSKLVFLDGVRPVMTDHPSFFHLGQQDVRLRIDFDREQFRTNTASVLELRSLGQPSAVVDEYGHTYFRAQSRSGSTVSFRFDY